MSVAEIFQSGLKWLQAWLIITTQCSINMQTSTHAGAGLGLLIALYIAS